ncbi:hypothetical protein [Actinomadura sp. WMMB 499]|uniref:hypothetical protein n=1 Tax=Actinomadura sp. WMMB 499 TaxID=1219491 RepID=UPI0012484C29|nr:hypothetical protein [Actinomadura sp. WMMB 499]QFG22247.1 hypothetical protein F7P10_15050 [Actinomadura sp. WMMB 499]
MTAEELANRAVDVLAGTLPAIAGRTDPAIVALHELVRRRLDGTGWFEAFEARPADGSLVRELLRRAVEHDRAFAAALADATERARAAAPATGSSVHIRANSMTGDVTAAGRDNIETNTVTHSTNIGSGLVLPACVIIALIITATLLFLR